MAILIAIAFSVAVVVDRDRYGNGDRGVRAATHGCYESMRGATMSAFAKSWRRE
jgi:hypothetical protein